MPSTNDQHADIDTAEPPMPVEHAEVVEAEPATQSEAVEQPAKVMRIGSMIKLLLEEVRQSDLDEASRERLREIYETSVTELGGGFGLDHLGVLDGHRRLSRVDVGVLVVGRRHGGHPATRVAGPVSDRRRGAARASRPA